ncbi:hypothetical protein OSSY52_00750 [Tepiditoga spiralis]|uniref:DUF676 domain-containing protein n=1 Tax=Tepiditoga spiralis TaxID=2108365 RepID=A0A7G1G4J5_9BACT|nr:hypothetical protein [Tepiditoga spiralis]BBE29934.1 hypothetical protein OSSY52_00750 [Tepiditoga spiralis]
MKKFVLFIFLFINIFVFSNPLEDTFKFLNVKYDPKEINTSNNFEVLSIKDINSNECFIKIHWNIKNIFLSGTRVLLNNGNGFKIIKSLSAFQNSVSIKVLKNKKNSFIIQNYDKDGSIYNSTIKDVYIFYNNEKNKIISYKNKKFLIYKNLFEKNKNTLIYFGKKEEDFLEINALNLKSNSIVFPIGYTSDSTIASFVKERTKVSFINSNISFNFETKYPLISPEITKSGFHEIFPIIPASYISKKLNLNFNSINIRLFYKNEFKDESYSELWKVKPKFSRQTYEEEAMILHKKISGIRYGYRIPEKSINTEVYNKKRKAIIFVHGIQINRYLENFFKEKFPWRTLQRFGTFNNFFRYIYENDEKFKNFDFYEFIYDSHTMTAKEFGKKLYELMEKGKFKDYKELYFISHSMGGLVTRYALNFSNYTNIVNIINIDAVNYGSSLQNLIELFAYKSFDEKIDENIESAIKILENSLNDTISQKKLNLDNELKILFKTYPYLIPAILSEYNILDTFNGGYSIRSSNTKKLNKLNNTLFKKNLFTPSKDIINLNKNDKYLNKLLLIYSKIDDYDPIVTFNFSHSVLEFFGRITNSSKYEIENDGAVTVASQMMYGYNVRRDSNYINGRNHETFFNDYKMITELLNKYVLINY